MLLESRDGIVTMKQLLQVGYATQSVFTFQMLLQFQNAFEMPSVSCFWKFQQEFIPLSRKGIQCLSLSFYLRTLLINGLSILKYLLLATQHAIVQFNCVLWLVHREFPDEEDLRSIWQIVLDFWVARYLRFNMLADLTPVLKNRFDTHVL